MKQLHIYFVGHVQGVGFRQTASRLARGFQVVGWIKNLNDGRVEMLVEGEEVELQRFFESVRSQMKNCIQETEAKWGKGKREFFSFEIAY